VGTLLPGTETVSNEHIIHVIEPLLNIVHRKVLAIIYR
jgi:hypothetical protein